MRINRLVFASVQENLHHRNIKLSHRQRSVSSARVIPWAVESCGQTVLVHAFRPAITQRDHEHGEPKDVRVSFVMTRAIVVCVDGKGETQVPEKRWQIQQNRRH